MKLNKIAPPPKGTRNVAGNGIENPLWMVVKKLVDAGMEARRPFERQWILNLAFLHGKQYSFFNSASHSLQVVGLKKGKKRIVDNQILPRWRRQVNDWIRAKPMMSGVPNSNEDKDIQAANVAQKVLEHFWRDAQMSKKNRKLGGWVHATGNGFLVDSWNPELGPEMVDRETGKIVYAGDAEVSVWSPLEVIVPSAGFAEISDMPWIIKHRWKDLSWIEGKYKKGKDVRAEDRSANMSELTSMIDGLGASGSEKEEGAFVIDLYIRPNSEFPKGKFIVAANGIVLEEKDYPFNYYPIEQFKDLEIPGVFWGYATMNGAIPLQTVWNNTLTSINQFNEAMCKGKWLVPRGCNMEEDPNSEHGEVIEYTPQLGRKPDQVDLKGLPSTVDGILAIVKVSMEDLFSQHEVSRGTNKSDIRSGEMVALLREQDAIGVVGTHAIFEESLEATMKRVLKRIQAGYTSERMIKIRGQEGDFEVLAFKGADLRNNTDVHVVKQSSLSDSRVAREGQIIAKFQAGLYGDPADPEVRRHVMRMLEDAVVKDIYSDTIADETYARFENRLISEGKGQEMHLVNPYDNHAIHLKEHQHFQKGMEYQKAKVGQDAKSWMLVELAFREHTSLHQKFIAEAEAAQLQKMAMLKGGGA